MRLAVLPFNAAPGTPPSLARQFANFAVETLRNATQADVNFVSYLAQVETPAGPKGAFVNVSEALLERDWLQRFFGEVEAERVMDGLLEHTPGTAAFVLTTRFHDPEGEEPLEEFKFEFDRSQLFESLHYLIKQMAKHAGATLPPELAGEKMEFGTDDPEAFVKFVEGYDALMYLQQTNGQVPPEFDPEPALDALREAFRRDRDFLGAYEMIVQYCRALARFRLGRIEPVERALQEALEAEPTDFKAAFALAEVFEAAGNPQRAKEWIEKAIEVEDKEPALYARLGLLQSTLGMPNNAEKSFRQALALEGPEKPSTDYLSMVLFQTGRGHEVPPMWKELCERFPENPFYAGKLAMALIQSGSEKEGVAVFETALELPDNLFIKRAYAPYLVDHADVDRALDFYEDCLEQGGEGDVQLNFEYANALAKADREFEIPPVLKRILQIAPDQNVKAQAQAWLLEIEQKKRTDLVEKARQKAEEGDFAAVVKELRPLKNWLADYWKLWILLANAHNRLNEPAEAEEAARKLIEVFPGNEAGYIELSNALTSLGNLEEAYMAARYAASTLQTTPQIMITLGLAAKRAGHTEEAQAIAEQIRRAIPDNAELAPVLSEMEA